MSFSRPVSRLFGSHHQSIENPYFPLSMEEPDITGAFVLTAKLPSVLELQELTFPLNKAN